MNKSNSKIREQNNEVSNEADEAGRKFKHRAVTTQAGKAVTGQSRHIRTTPNFITTVARAGEEQAEILQAQRSSVGDVVCSLLKDTILHGTKTPQRV